MAANYTQTEVLNAVAQIFRARIDSSRTGGVRNNREEFEQLMELTSITFLMYPDAIFYLAQLVCNTLASQNRREIAIIEDMLVALEYLSRLGSPVRDTATLNNAKTALYGLDAVGSVTARPETKRFISAMNRYAYQLSKNSVDLTGDIVRTREEARAILRLNFQRLVPLHTQLITGIQLLRDLLSSFISLNVPTKVSVEAFANIQKVLDDLLAHAEAPDVENLANSRNDMLLALSSVSAVDTISTFSNPGELKYRSPNNPIPVGVDYLGQVTGEGLPASVLSGFGPWSLPLSSPLLIKVNGGADQSVPVDQLNTTTMPGTTKEPFDLTNLRQLHVVVDPNQRTGTIKIGSSASVLLLNEVIPLLFKHLGAIVSVTPLTGGDATSDSNPRAIVGFPLLQTFGQSVWNATTSQLTLTNITVGEDSVTGFRAGHVGYFVQDDLGQRFEILSVDDLTLPTPNLITIDARGLTPSWGVFPTAHAFTLHGQPIGTTQTKFTVGPVFSASRVVGQNVAIGPTAKTVKLTAAVRTVDQVIADIEAELSDADPANVGSAMNWHLKALHDPSDANRVALVPRSLADPYVSISSLFVAPSVGTTGLASFIEGSCNDVLGLPLGTVLSTPFDVTTILTADELAAMINQSVSGVEAEVEQTEVHSGADLSTDYNATTVHALDTDWLKLGIQSGQIIEIFSGRAAGSYQISGVTSSNLTLAKSSPFPASESGLSYRIYNLRVRVSSVSAAKDCSLEISGASELGFDTAKAWGTIPQFEAVDDEGGLLSFDRVAVGDFLKLGGSRDEYTVTAVNGTELTVDPSLPSNTNEVQFEIAGAAARQYEVLNADLTTFTSSAALLRKNGFDESLAALDAALTSVITPGQSFAFNQNRVKQLLADLMSMLTDSPLRMEEYTAVVPTAPMNLEDILKAYSVESVAAFEGVLDAFIERRYDRAADLLRQGDISTFYGMNEETASYAGNMMNKMRVVNQDLPDTSSVSGDVTREIHVATSSRSVPDAEINFSDIEGEFSIDD